MSPEPITEFRALILLRAATMPMTCVVVECVKTQETTAGRAGEEQTRQKEHGTKLWGQKFPVQG